MADVNALKTAVDGYLSQVISRLSTLDSNLAQLESQVSEGEVIFSNANNEAGNYVGRLLVSQNVAIVRGSEELSAQQQLTQSVNPSRIYDIQSDVFYQWNGSSWVTQSTWTVSGQFEPGRIYSNNYVKRLFYYSPNLGMIEINAGKGAPEVLLGSYTDMSPLSSGRAKHAAAVIGNEMFVQGGSSGASNFSMEFLKYDFLNGVWSTLPTASFGRSDHAMVSYDGKLYLFGGESSGGVENDLFVCEPSVSEFWSSLNPSTQPPARSKYSMCVVDGKIYVYGGENSAGSALSDLWVYDISANTWTQLASSSSVNYDSVLVHYNGFLYRQGGRTSSSTISSSWSRYDIAGNSWEDLGPSWTLSRHSAAVIGNKMYVYAGEGSTGGDHYNTLRYINLDTQQTGAVATGGPHDLIRHSMVVWDYGLYVLGGIEDTQGNRVTDLTRIK